MRTERTAVRLGPLLSAVAAWFFVPPVFSWDNYAVDGFSPPTAQAPPAVFQRDHAVVAPAAPRGDSQRRWYAPVERRDGRAFVESMPVGTFRPLDWAPPPVEWGYKGYNFRPLRAASGPLQAPARSRQGTRHLSTGVRTEPNHPLPGAGWYSDYGRGSPRFNFRPNRQPVRQPSKDYDSYNPTQPAVGADYPGTILDVPSTDYYAPRTVDGPQPDLW